MIALWILCCVFVFRAGADRFDVSQAITTVPYGIGQISVWRDEVVQGRYYMSPVAWLLPNTAKIVDNVFNGQVFLDLSVLLWSIETRQVVMNHLDTHLKLTVSDLSIQLLPIEKLRFVWTDRGRPALSHYKLMDNWLPSSDLPSVAKFQISCRDTAKCNTLKAALQTNPDLFYALEMLYLTNPMVLGEVTVTGAHMARSGVYSEIARMPVRGEVRYVTSDVADTLAAQTVAVAVSFSLYDSVTSGDEMSVTNALKGVLKFQQVSTSDFTPAMWNSLFWRPTFARPDKLSKFLNTILLIDRNDTAHFLVEEGSISDSYEHGACAVELGLNASNLNLTRGNSSVYRIRRETVFAALRTKHVEWTGERFRARQLSVYRLNMAVLNSSSSLVSGKVRVREYGAVKRVKVRAGNVTVTQKLTPELVEARMKVEMNRAQSKVERELNEVTAELEEVRRTTANLKTELSQTTTNLGVALNQSTTNLKTELIETTTNLGVALNQSAVGIVNSTLKRLGNVFNGWPEYCRFSGHYCNTNHYSAFSSPRTAGECMKVCDASARCQGFGFWSDDSIRCGLFDYICPYDKMTSKSTRDHYIKLSHVPILTTEIWKSIFTNNSLVNIPADPCHVAGEYFAYTRV